MGDVDSGWQAYAEGMRFGWNFRFSDEEMRSFERLSGDHNPIHTDSNFAKARGFRAPIIFGLLLASQVSRLIGQELPDKRAMLTGVSLIFMGPAFANDSLRFDAEIVTKSEAAHALEFKCRISRAGKTLCRGTAEAVWKE